IGRYTDVVDEQNADVMQTIPVGVSWKDEGQKLTTYLYETDKYLKSGAQNVEQAVDKLLFEDESKFEHDTDIAVLLTWLEALFPAVQLDVNVN
ncbi:hypothetical protein SCHPADRAFT_948122, partial [Schizopora paradoxa]